MAKKTHHAPDYAKNKTADVIKKGSDCAIPQEQWERNYNLTPAGKDRPSCDEWLPRPGKDRPTPHKKLNECDH